MDLELNNIVEALIFASDQPLKPDLILEILNRDEHEGAGNVENEASNNGKQAAYSSEQLQPILDTLIQKYHEPIYPFEIRKVAEGYQFFTKRPYYPFVKKAVVQKNKKRLTRSAVETLSIIAYRQPVTKAEVEYIRGVNCDYAIQKLLEKKLLSIVGRADAPGRPLLYATSPFFMQYFGLSDMTEMPKLKEFEELKEEHLELFRQHQEAKEENSDEQEKTTGEQTEDSVLEESDGGQEESPDSEGGGQAEGQEEPKSPESPEAG